MRSEHFDLFISEFGEATHAMPADPAVIEFYRGRLPDLLLDVWLREGWNGYANGLLWTVNPRDYEGLLEDWLRGTHYPQIDRYHVLARTAFGKLFLWGERNNQTMTLNAATGIITALEKNMVKPEKNLADAVNVFFAAKDKEGCDLKDINKVYLFERALAKYGPLGPNEIYGLEPALVTGGRMQLESLRRVNLFVHLSLLRELAAPMKNPLAAKIGPLD